MRPLALYGTEGRVIHGEADEGRRRTTQEKSRCFFSVTQLGNLIYEIFRHGQVPASFHYDGGALGDNPAVGQADVRHRLPEVTV